LKGINQPSTFTIRLDESQKHSEKSQLNGTYHSSLIKSKQKAKSDTSTDLALSSKSHNSQFPSPTKV